MQMLGRRWTRPSAPSSTTWKRGAWMRRCCWSSPATSAGRRGSTPAAVATTGRQHSTLALAGGGVGGGRVIGRSTRQADRPASDPVTLADLMATLMRVLFDLPLLRLQPGVPREIAGLLEGGTPIPGLL